MAIDASGLRQEREIVWLEDPQSLPYVRSVSVLSATRDQPITTVPGAKPQDSSNGGSGKASDGGPCNGSARIVGYSVLQEDAAPLFPRTFRRRVFYLAVGDRPNAPDGAYRTSCPVDGVDPLTIAAGVPGHVTERAWPQGRPHKFPTLDADRTASFRAE